MLKNDSCPNCRHEANENERIAENEHDSDTESEYESTDYDDDGSEASLEIPEFDEEDHAFWVFRTTLQMAETGQSLEPQGILPQVPEDNDLLSLWVRSSKLGPQFFEDRGYESA